MSRRRGRRERPASEQRAARERYTKPARRRRTAPAEPGSSERPTLGRRRWSSALAGTIISVLVFGLVANSIVAAGDGKDSVAILSSVAAALLVPVLLVVIGYVSRAPSPWRTAAVWGPAALVLFGIATLAAREPATGYVLAIGIGATRAMRPDDGSPHRSWRTWAAVGLALYTKVVYLLSPGLAIVAAPLLPIAGVAIIDSVAERQLGR